MPNLAYFSALSIGHNHRLAYSQPCVSYPTKLRILQLRGIGYTGLTALLYYFFFYLARFACSENQKI